MNQHTYKQAIQALFEGRATTLQKALIEEWLSQPSHKELYFQWLEEWEQQNPQLIVDTLQAYTKWVEEVNTESIKPLKSPLFFKQRPSFFWWIAASISLLLLASTYLMRDAILYKYHETAYGELRTLTLPDSSRVVLNANSTLKVPRFGFGIGSRKVFLTGEAEFSIQHLSSHQRFIVQTPDQLEVQVLGTEFMVYSRARGSKVVLNKGKVQLRSLKNQDSKPLIISTGDVVTISTLGRLTLKHNQPIAPHASWKEHRFAFQNTKVSEIAYQLSERFGIQVIIADSSLAKRTLGGTFKAESAEAFLHVMADLLELEVVRSHPSEDSSPTYTLDYLK